MHSVAELRELVSSYLGDLELAPELGTLEEPIRYAVGGKLIRPVLTLATAEAAGTSAEEALPAGVAVELVHSFSLVHDDLPAFDDDQLRRDKPTVHVEYGERTAILVGDALLAEAFRLALTYDTPQVAQELAQATLRMIGGQQLDFEGATKRESVHRLKTAALFEAPVACALWVARVPEDEQPAWRVFGFETGMLFQAVDDLLDDDGLVDERGAEATRALADERADRARAALDELNVDTSVLAEIVDVLATRTA
jgi:geranylgeranyl diphosphate synthase type II